MESKEALLQCFPEAFDPGRGVCCGHPSWKRLLQASHTMAIIDQEYCIRLPVPSLAYQTGWTASHLIYQLQISRSIVSRGGRDLWFKCTNITVTNKTCVRAPFIRSDSSEPSRLHALVLSPFPITVLTTDGQRHCSRVPVTTDHISRRFPWLFPRTFSHRRRAHLDYRRIRGGRMDTREANPTKLEQPGLIDARARRHGASCLCRSSKSRARCYAGPATRQGTTLQPTTDREG